MVSAGGAALRGVGTLLYALDFLCAAGIVGIYSYFIAALVKSNLVVNNTWRAVEGLSGAAVLYTIFAILLTCFLGGMRVFAFMGIILDILFMGAMIAIAVLTRGGIRSCGGTPNTVFGIGASNAATPVEWHPTYGTACKLQKSVFSLAVAGAVLFLLTAIVQFFISAHHQKEKKYGPGPSNGYTSGSGKRTWWHKKTATTEERFPKDAEIGMVAAAPVVAYETIPRTNVVRPSHDTTHTETTAVGANNDYGNGTLNKIEHRTDRTILPPVLDRPVSRAESRNVPVEVAGASGMTGANATNTYYSAPAERTGYVADYTEQATPGYYPAPVNESVLHADPAGVDVTRAIFGHENTNTGRAF